METDDADGHSPAGQLDARSYPSLACKFKNLKLETHDLQFAEFLNYIKLFFLSFSSLKS